VARLLEVAEARDADVVADNQTLRDIGDSTRTSAAFDYVKAGEVLTVDKAFFFDHIWEEGGQYPMGLLKPMFRRSFLQDNNIRYDPRHRLGEDFLFYLDCVVRDARFYMLGDQYYFYTQRPDSLSRVRSDVFIALARMCDEVVETRRALLDAYSIDKLNDRRDGIQRLVRRLQIQEIRDLRRQGKLGALLEYGMKNPQAGFELIKSAFLWRMGKRAS
jgi:succinoglycan biosynthesis protein ExoO